MTVNGGDGNDTLSSEFEYVGTDIALNGDANNDVLRTSTTGISIQGGAGNDQYEMYDLDAFLGFDGWIDLDDSLGSNTVLVDGAPITSITSASPSGSVIYHAIDGKTYWYPNNGPRVWLGW